MSPKSDDCSGRDKLGGAVVVLLGTLIGPDIVAAALGPLGGGIGGGVPKLGRLGAFCVALLRVVE